MVRIGDRFWSGVGSGSSMGVGDKEDKEDKGE